MESSVKVAKINARMLELETAKELLLAVLDNPAVDLVAGTVLIEMWARADEGSWSYELAQGLIKTGLEATLAVVCTAMALSPVMNSSAAGALVERFVK